MIQEANICGIESSWWCEVGGGGGGGGVDISMLTNNPGCLQSLN